MGRLFGTDGVRGVAGRDLTARLALDLSAAAAHELGLSRPASPSRRPRAVVGRDPRVSGEFLEAAVVAGLASSGVDVLRLGVLPTPAVAYLTRALDADFGVVLSASHNPAPDNGIKFFARGGVKLPDAVEDRFEARVEPGRPEEPPAAGFGRVVDAQADQERYLGQHRGGHGLEAGRSTALIDVVPVGFHPDRDDLGARPAERLRCDGVGGSMRAVDDDTQARQR